MLNFGIISQCKYFNNFRFIAIISFVFYYVSLFILCTSTFAHFLNNELIYHIYAIFTYFKSIAMIVLLPFICLIPDLFMHFLRFNFYPDPADKIFSNEKYFLDKIIMEREAKRKESIKEKKLMTKNLTKKHTIEGEWRKSPSKRIHNLDNLEDEPIKNQDVNIEFNINSENIPVITGQKMETDPINYVKVHNYEKKGSKINEINKGSPEKKPFKYRNNKKMFTAAAIKNLSNSK